MKTNLRYYLLLWLVAISTMAMAAYPYIENKGQLTDQYHHARSDVRFYTDYKGNDIFIADHGMHYRWLNRKDSLRSSYRVDIDLLGAAAHSQALTGEASPDFRNYYNASAEGILGVHSYDGVTLCDIYPHIDWHFYTADSTMEYDFIIRPGGAVNTIRMQVSGAMDLKLQDDGSLKITTPFGSSVQQAPVARQGGREVPVRFALHGTELSFLVGTYDTAQTLVIDPIIQVWGTYYDGYEPSDIKTDKYGNVYAVGTTYATTGLSTGPHQITYGGGSSDGYIVKFDKNGQRVWATYYGGTGDDKIYGCSVDTFGNLFVSGTTTSPGGIAFNGFKNSINSLPDTVYGSDAFLIKFNPGGVRQWGTYLGSIGQVQDYGSGQFVNREVDDFGYECATDPAGNVFIVGSHRVHLSPCYTSNGSSQIPCTDVFIGTAGSYQPQPVHPTSYGTYGDDAFIAKFSSTGSRLWGTYIGTNDDYGSSRFNGLYCTTDRKGNVYIAGTTDSLTSGNTLGIGGFQNTANWRQECWLSKLNANGTNVLWSTYYGNYGDDYATDICTDAQGNVFLAGTTTSTSPGAYSTFVTSGLFYPAFSSSAQTPFLAKFDSAGARRWSTYYSEAIQSFSGNLAADDSGRVLYTVYSNNLNYDYPVTKKCNNFWNSQSMSVSLFTPTGNLIWGELYRNYNRHLGRDRIPCDISHNGKNIFAAETIDNADPNVPLHAYQSTFTGTTSAIICMRDSALYDTISGHVFTDMNANGVKDGTDTFINNRIVAISVADQYYTTTTDVNGYYQFILPRWGVLGSCYSQLHVFTSQEAATMPVNTTYYNYSPYRSIYDFGLAPATVVTGSIYYDDDHNGTRSSISAEPGIPFQSVTFNSLYQVFDNSYDGSYMAIIPYGNQTELYDKNDAYTSSVSSPASYSFYGAIGATNSGKDFGAYFPGRVINSAIDMWSNDQTISGRAFDQEVMINNVGSALVSDTVVIHYDPALIYNAATNNGWVADTINQVLTLITDSIVPARFHLYSLNFTIRPGTPAGYVLRLWGAVNPNAQPDVDTTDNRTNIYYVVLASYDPNDKIASTNTDTPYLHKARLWSDGRDYIKYRIDFQNTGTYLAYDITLLDSLSPLLDWSTVRVLASSHACMSSRYGNLLNFRFSNINLPPASVNDSASKGYVVFEIKPTIYARPGDSIPNHAAIYFDYNTAVLTNTNVVRLIGDSAPHRAIYTNVYAQVCSNQSYTYHGHTYAGPGLYYTDTARSVMGVDSITVLHLDRNRAIDFRSIYVSQCDFSHFIYEGDTIRGPGTYYSDTFQNRYGCDSIRVLTVYRGGSSTYGTSAHLCRGAYYIFYGDTIWTAGTFIHHFTAVNGCDSIRQLYVDTNYRVYYSTRYIYVCDYSNITFHGDTIRHAGTYFGDTVRTAGGCDSVDILYVYDSYYPYTYHYSSVTLCHNNYVILGHDTIRQDGYYSDTLQGSYGCDSIISLRVTNFNYRQKFLYYCTAGGYYYHGQYYTAYQHADDTIPSATGCDTIVSTYFYQNIGVSYESNDTLCNLPTAYLYHNRSVNLRYLFFHNSFTYSYYNNTYYTTLYDTIHLSSGCDSLTSRKVYVIIPWGHSTYYLSSCGQSGQAGQPVLSPGVYDTVYHLPDGCDEAVTMTVLAQGTNVYYYNSLRLCVGDSIQIRGRWYHGSATSYTIDLVDTFASSCGSDSMVHTRYTFATSGIWQPYYYRYCLDDTVTIDNVQYTTDTTFTRVYHVGCYDSTLIYTIYSPYSYLPSTPDVYDTICPNQYVYTMSPYRSFSSSQIYIDTAIIPLCADTLIFRHFITVLDNCYLYAYTDSTYAPGCNGSNGHIALQVVGGLPPYTYLWSTGSTAPSIYPIQAGLYTVTITDALGVTTSTYITLGGARTWNYYISNYISQGCYRESKTVQLNMNGNYQHFKAPLTISYDTFTSPQTFVNTYYNSADVYSVSIYGVSPGFHTFYIMDSTGCRDTLSVYVPGDAVHIHNVKPASCFGNGGSKTLFTYDSYYRINTDVTLEVEGLPAPLHYHQMYGTDTLYGLRPGYHHYTITNTTGCSYTDSFYVADDSVHYVLGRIDVQPAGGCLPMATLYVQGTVGIPQYHYSWQQGQVSDTLITHLPATGYVLIHDSTAVCYDSLSYYQPAPAGDTTRITATSCIGSSYLFHGQVITATGVYTVTLSNRSGCDSVVILSVPHLGHGDSIVVVDTFCSGGYLFHGHQYYVSGTYMDTLINSTGCDSVTYLHLTKTNVDTVNVTAPSCMGSSYLFNGQVIAATGLYTATFTNRLGCDSVVILSVPHLGHADSIVMVDTFCSGGYLFHGHQYHAPGTYIDTLINSYGCDSVTYLHLVRLNSDTTFISGSACSGTGYYFGGATLYAPGRYTEHTGLGHSCDSVTILDLMIYTSYADTVQAAICHGDSVYFANQWLHSAGTYTHSSSPIGGCDSIVTLTLSVSAPVTGATSATICQGASYAFAGNSYTTAGTYTGTFTASSGCDSIVTLTLSVSAPVTQNLEDTICDGEAYYLGGTPYNSTGTYTNTVSSAGRCDTLQTLHLIVLPSSTPTLHITVSPGPAVNGLQADTFRANYTGCDGAYYSWYLNLQPVGQHDSLAIITHHIAHGDSIICRIDCGNRCASTTYTYSRIVISGLTDHDPLISSMAVYPNPNHGSFILESSGLMGVRYTIYDMLSKEVMTRTIRSNHEHIDLPGAASGVYNVQIQSGDDIHILRLIIEN